MSKSFKGTIQGQLDDQGNAIFTGVFKVDDPPPPPPPPPPPLPTAIVDLISDSLDIGTRFNAHVRPGTDFRSVTGNRLQSRNNNASNGIDVQRGRILFPINWVAPIYANTKIETSLPVNPPNAHCQVRLSGKDLEQQAWTKPSVTYRWEAEVDLPASSLWSQLSWVLPMQAHPGDHGPDWANPHSRPPAIAIYMKRDRWEFWARGSDEAKPTSYRFNSVYGRATGEHTPFTPGLQEITIEFRCDPRTPGRSFATFFLNGERLVKMAHPIGLNHSALGAGKPALNLAMGYYGTQPANLPDPATQKGIVSIVSTRLSDVGVPPPPPPSTAPQLTVEGNSFAVPHLQALPHQKRGWFYPSVIYANSDFHVFSPVDEQSGRHLYTTRMNDPSIRRKLKDNVEQVAAWKKGGVFFMSGIGKSGGGFYRFTGEADNNIDWTFATDLAPNTGPYPMGDVHTAVPGEGYWHKGHDWVKDAAGKTIDFRRRWFYQGQELQGLIPPPPSDGLRYETYMLSIIKPFAHQWASKTKFVALAGMFKITDPAQTPNQHGPINLVWAVSDDGVNWDLPWGDAPAVDPGPAKMVGPSFNMLPWGSKLLVHCGIHHVEHNEWGANQNSVVGMGLASMAKSEFEQRFG